MKNISKLFGALVLFSFSMTMGTILSTDVYLINHTNVPLIQGPITTAIGKFRAAADQSKKEGRIKIRPGEKKKLFSIPRLLPLQARFHEKSTNIKREGDRDIDGIVIHVSAERKSVFDPTKIRSYWGLKPHFTLKKQFVFKLGKVFKELHITVLPRTKTR